MAYQNLGQATVLIYTTSAHYLDARNFPDGNDSADPMQEHLQGLHESLAPQFRLRVQLHNPLSSIAVDEPIGQSVSILLSLSTQIVVP
ncbi:hypothetical protein [Pectobacterium polaris]|uniref:hypothetical protein n=1 Tax=Pectobacterium polaris TaxID=2042057 RepID=UPI0020C6CA72|nr:hypothetical protein [Pectobacterium polaris]